MPADSKFKLPPMGVNPDTITVHGFSGGSYMAHAMHTIYSETIAGSGVKCGGPWFFQGEGSNYRDFDIQLPFQPHWLTKA